MSRSTQVKWAAIGIEMVMTLLRRFSCLVSFVFVFAAFSSAQALPSATEMPTEETAKSWLLSGDPRLVAWGAHDARLAGYQNLIPDLLSLASRWQPLPERDPNRPRPLDLSPEQIDEEDAMQAVLDALIQMNVTVPADNLRTLALDFGNDVAVFLARMPTEESGPLSFELYRSLPKSSYGLRYVCAALLALHPLPGFAAHLLSDTSVPAFVHVVRPGQRFGVGRSEGSCSSTREQQRKDWPMSGQYALSKNKDDASTVVVAGIDPVYVMRSESTGYLGVGCAMTGFVNPGPRERRRLVAELLRVPPEEIPWQTRQEVFIEFQSLQQFDRDLLRFIEKQQQMYRLTADSLEAMGLLTHSEALQSVPELALLVEDARHDGSARVPKPLTLPARVSWAYFP